MTNIKAKLRLCLSVCLFLACGCDGYYIRQSVIDFEKVKSNDIAADDAARVNKMFTMIELIAQNNDMKCTGNTYDDSKRFLKCDKEAVHLTANSLKTRRITIELVQFGPLEEDKPFISVNEALSQMLKEEFPGQNIQMINPKKDKNK